MPPQTPMPAQMPQPVPSQMPPAPETQTAPQAGKAPILIIIFAWIYLLAGILQVFAGLSASAIILIAVRTLSGASIILGLIGLLGLVLGVVSITIGVGLRKMRRWALYWVVAGTTIGIISGFMSHFSSTTVAYLVFDIVVLIYLWTIRKQFV